MWKLKAELNGSFYYSRHMKLHLNPAKASSNKEKPILPIISSLRGFISIEFVE